MDSMSAAVIELAEKHLGNFTVKNGQVVAEYCPICHGHDHDKETFAIGLSNGLWQCLRGSCGQKGNFNQLCSLFGEENTVGYNLPRVTAQKKKSYTKPDPEKILPITDEIITYFAKRKISEQTLKDWKIGSNDKGNIVFPFYRDNELVYVKYRKPKRLSKEDGPKEWTDNNLEPILYGMDMTTFNKPLVIVEGQIDALSVYEAGVPNVVSVPAGCNNLEWINLCWEWLDKFNQFILLGDNDEPGMEMVSVISKRLGEDKCMIPKEYPECIWNGKDQNRLCKDANEIL